MIFSKVTTNVSLLKNFRLFNSKIVKLTLLKQRKVVFSIMQRITGIPHNQLRLTSLEDTISCERKT